MNMQIVTCDITVLASEIKMIFNSSDIMSEMK